MTRVNFILTFLLAMSISAVSQAQEPIRLTSPWGEGSMAFPLLEGLYDYDSDSFRNNIDILGSCVEATNIMKNSNEPTLTISEALFLDGDNPCNILEEEYFITTVGLSTLNFCTLNPDEEVALEEFQGDVRVGHFNGDMFRLPVTAILENMSGSGSKAVPYESTPAARAALQAGEVDFIVTSQNDADKNCFLTTSETDDSFAYKVSDFYDGEFSNAFYTFAILGTNVDKEAVKEAFVESTDPSINNIYVDGRGKNYDREFVKESREHQLDVINSYVDSLRNAKD